MTLAQNSFSHAPADYVCPFCAIARRETHLETQVSDIFYQTEHITAFIASRWWPNNPGHALIIPNQHIENIYDLVPEIAVHVHEAARQVAIAFKHVYGADGTSTRQHNEPAGYQEVFHYHLHVFPRYHNDYLYDLSSQRRKTTPEERLVYAEKLRAYFADRG
jgi:histidine triad (HIT) family protein